MIRIKDHKLSHAVEFSSLQVGDTFVTVSNTSFVYMRIPEVAAEPRFNAVRLSSLVNVHSRHYGTTTFFNDDTKVISVEMEATVQAVKG